MTMLMGDLLNYLHQLEDIQLKLRWKHQWSIARSLDPTLELLRKELELLTVNYEIGYGGTS